MTLRLTRLTRRTFEAAGSPVDPDYYPDMAKRYGVAFRPDLLDGGARNSFTAMAEGLLADLGPLPGPLEVIVIGHTVPDFDPSRFAACALSEAAAGDPLAFGITDQGLATSFTALRVAGEYAGGGQVLVVLLDQTTLPYDTDLPPELEPVADSGVALLLEGDGRSVRVFADVPPEGVRALLETELADLPPVTLVAGAGLGGELPELPEGPDRVLRVPPGRPATGLWWTLADNPALRVGGGSRVVLADYDRRLRYLCLATVER